MSDELDEFLRQAAERRRMRQQEKAARPPIAPAQPAQPAPPPRREPEPVRSLRPSVSDDAYERGSAARTNPHDLQQPPMARRLQSQFEQPAAPPTPPAKEKRSSRKKQPADLPRRLGDNTPLTSSLSLDSSLADESSFSSNQSGASIKGQAIGQMLRNPNSLPLGTILVLGEVLKRPWE